MRLPKVVYMLPDELEDYVHNEAIVGDILKSFSNECGVLREYVYCCNKDNIGKDVKPGWMMLGYNNSFVVRSEGTMKQCKQCSKELPEYFSTDICMECSTKNMKNLFNEYPDIKESFMGTIKKLKEELDK